MDVPMSAHSCDKGLILREVPYKDADMMLTVLTETNGKISAAARGVRRKSSRMSAALQHMAYSEFTFFESSGRYTINEAEPIELFYPVRQDIDKLALASYFAELLEVTADAETVNPELLRLGLNALYALSNLPVDTRALKAAFELRISMYAGYAPTMGNSCAVCGKSYNDMFFNLNDGAVCCKGCCGFDALPIDAGALAAINHVNTCDLKRIFSFSLGEESLKKLSAVSEAYLMRHFDRRFSTLSFYKSLSSIK